VECFKRIDAIKDFGHAMYDVIPAAALDDGPREAIEKAGWVKDGKCCIPTRPAGGKELLEWVKLCSPFVDILKAPRDHDEVR
jgi:hypothetical protein